MAKAIAPNGILYAVDIDQNMLDDAAGRATQEGVTNLRTVLAEYDDPKLPVRDVDVAFYRPQASPRARARSRRARRARRPRSDG